MSAALAGLEEASGLDARACAGFIGTSAGSIVSAALAGGVSPRQRLAQLTRSPAEAQAERAGPPTALAQALAFVWGIGGTALASAAAPGIGLALRATEPAGALLRRALLARLPTGRRSLAELGRAIERLQIEWDGRLRVAAVEIASGRRVLFGARGARQASVSEAVQASCAIPGVFRPVRVGARAYVDGGVWSPTNMDAAHVARGARVLCLNPTASLRTPIPVGTLGAMSRSLAAGEAFALRRRGARVIVIRPDRGCSDAMGGNLLDPRPRAAVIAAGLEQGRRLAERLATAEWSK
jgi:NTE family protein